MPSGDYLNLDLPETPPEPSVVLGLIEFQDLALRLECLTTQGLNPEVLRGTWYEDANIKIGGGALLIKNLAECNPHQVKLVLSHLPKTRVYAVTADLRHPYNDAVLQALGTFLQRVFVTWRQPDCTMHVAEYVPGSHAALASLPFRPAAVTAEVTV